MPSKPKRVYFHFQEREEFAAGMWRTVTGDDRERYVTAAAELMRDPDSFEGAMVKAVSEWPKSCAAALTAESMNRRAWLGHAGCFIATESPEDLTRRAWNTLTSSEQIDANAAADRAIQAWEDAYTSAALDAEEAARVRAELRIDDAKTSTGS